MAETKRHALGGLIAIAVAVGGYMFFFHDTDTAMPQASLKPTKDDTKQSAISVKPVVVVDSPAPGAAYSRAKNINAYISSIHTASSPPGTAEIAQAKALDECGSLIARPNSAKTQIANLQAHGGKYSQFQIKALQLVDERCKDFVITTRMTGSDAHALYKKSAVLGNPEAKAINLANEINSMPAEKARPKVMAVISAGDPDALFAIANVFSETGPFETTSGGEVGTPDAKYSWQLAACDQGKDCTASSEIVQQSCLYLGLCGPGDYRTNIQYSAVSPASYQLITQAETRINEAIANGTVQDLLVHK
jgi:hypothetical protein